jgi:2,3-bisphosphoglycerate-dependent phosphoglycerate mutase
MDDEHRLPSGMLILIRHGESQWNAKNIWTGLTDIGLSPKGENEAREAAHKITDVRIDCAFTSLLCRASDTLRIILDSLGNRSVPVTANGALNERNYGVFTGKNKLEVQSSLGVDEYRKLRRGWDYPIENGESLKQVYERVTPYYEKEILPLLRAGKHVLVVSHGNTLRSLIKRIEHLSDEAITHVELATGEIILYGIDENGNPASKDIRTSV